MSELSKKVTKNGLPVLVMTLLSLTSSFIGIFNQQLYGSGEVVGDIWFSQNIVSLLIVIPAVMFFFHSGFTRHILKAKIILLGLTSYFIYSSIFYVFNSSYNILYFINLPLLTISIYSFVVQFPRLNEQNVHLSVPGKELIFSVSVYMLAISCLLMVYWAIDFLSFVSVEKAAQAGFISNSGVSIFSVDIGFVAPLIVFGVIKMWQGNHFGHLIIGVMLVLAVILGLSLLIRLISQISMGLKGIDIFTSIIVLVDIAGLVFAYLFFKYLEVTPKRTVKIAREIPNKLLFRTQVMDN